MSVELVLLVRQKKKSVPAPSIDLLPFYFKY